MGLFPIFVDIKDKTCIVIGAGDVASRKIATLLQYDIAITVISPSICDSVMKLQEEEKIKIIKRHYICGDLEGAYMVLACASVCINLNVYEEIKKKSVYFNCAKPGNLSNFIFPAVIKRGELSIGITTSGASPSLTKRMRIQIEDSLPYAIESYTTILKEFRTTVIEDIKSQELRKQILNKAVELIDYNLEPELYRKKILKLLEGSI